MQLADYGSQRAVWVAFAGLLVGGAGLGALTRLVNLPAPPLGAASADQASAAPTLVLLRADRPPPDGAVRERLALLDPAPLYLPNDFSTGASAGVAPSLLERPGGRAAETFPAALRFPERQPLGGMVKPVLPDSPAEAARQLAEPRWFEGMAKISRAQDGGLAASSASIAPTPISPSPAPPPPLPPAPPEARRVARFEIYRVGEAGLVAAYELAADETLETAGGGWRPITLGVVVGVAGPLTRPSVISGSGIEAIDEHVRLRLARELLFKAALRPGAYRLEVGP